VAKKKKPKVEDEVDFDVEDDADEDPAKQPGADAYTGLVVITTLCLIAAAVLFYLDGDTFASAKGGNPNIAPNALVAVAPQPKG
jgi:hypothetical protein